MSTHNKVLSGLKTMARHCKQDLKVVVTESQDGVWNIYFQAGEIASVTCSLSTFIAAPRIVLDPFTEELIKRLK